MNRRTYKDILLVTGGNLLLMITKLITWLVIPKILGLQEYGYYKTFTLYLTYTSFLHLGFPDGMLLIHGNQSYEQLDKTLFRRNSRFFLIMQSLLALTIAIVSSLMNEAMASYIGVMLALDMVFVNGTTYFKFISQATMRFLELTKRNVVQAVLQVLIVAAIFTMDRMGRLKPDSKLYILLIVLADGLTFLWYTRSYKDLILGKAQKYKQAWTSFKNYFMMGIMLTLAYQTAHLVFVLDMQLVSINYDISTYSSYAFAYSIISMVTMTVNAMATVFFPNFKRMTLEESKKYLPELTCVVLIIAFGVLIGVWPISIFISAWLPDYRNALPYLKLVIPGLAMSCCINIIFFTFYKVYGWLKKYLALALFILAVGIVLNFGIHFFYPNPMAYSVGSILTLLIWFGAADWQLSCRCGGDWKKDFFYTLFMLTVYYAAFLYTDNWLKSAIIYVCLYFVILMFFYRRKIQGIWQKICRT